MSKDEHQEIESDGYPQATELYRARLATIDCEEKIARSLAYLGAVQDATDRYGAATREQVAAYYYASEWFSHHNPRYGVNAALGMLEAQRARVEIDSSDISGTLENLLLTLARAKKYVNGEVFLEIAARFISALGVHQKRELGRVEEVVGAWLYVGGYHRQAACWLERGLSLEGLGTELKASLERILAVARGKIDDSPQLVPADFWEALQRGDYETARECVEESGRAYQLCVEVAELERNFESESMETLLDEWLALLHAQGFAVLDPRPQLQLSEEPVEVEERTSRLADNLLLNTAICVRNQLRPTLRSHPDLELAQGLSNLNELLDELSGALYVPISVDHEALPLDDEQHEQLERVLARIRRRAEAVFQDNPQKQVEVVAEVNLMGVVLNEAEVGERTVVVGLQDLPVETVQAESAELARFPNVIGLYLFSTGVDPSTLASLPWENLQGLRVLDLSDNWLTELPPDVIRHPSLQWLRIAQNPQLAIELEELDLPALVHLDVRGNGWSQETIEALGGKFPDAKIIS